MFETASILHTYQKHRLDSEPLVLATVLRVQGSSYRQPGARMLIDCNGEIAGSVSGGCLERDLIQRARIQRARFVGRTQSRMEVIRYDTTDDGEDFESLSSVSLGCQGVVDIGLEVIPPGTTHPALELLRESIDSGKEGRIATIIPEPGNSEPVNSGTEDVGTENIGPEDIGTEDVGSEDVEPKPVSQELSARIAQDLAALQSTEVKSYETPTGKIEVLLERIRPPKRWIIFGAGHDSVPLAETAQAIGWHVTVVDCRSSYSMPQRFFSKVNELIRCEPSTISSRLQLTPDTLCVLATHNYFHDRTILGQLLPSPVAYIGLLGPKTKSISILDDFKKEGLEWDQATLSKLHSPVGIDTGAESPQEIALSIVTEALAISQRRTAGFLKDRDGPIHSRRTLSIGPLRTGTLNAGTLSTGTLNAGTLSTGTLNAGTLSKGRLNDYNNL